MLPFLKNLILIIMERGMIRKKSWFSSICDEAAGMIRMKPAVSSTVMKFAWNEEGMAQNKLQNNMLG